jgi:hypothetical protein
MLARSTHRGLRPRMRERDGDRTPLHHRERAALGVAGLEQERRVRRRRCGSIEREVRPFGTGTGRPRQHRRRDPRGGQQRLEGVEQRLLVLAEGVARDHARRAICRLGFHERRAGLSHPSFDQRPHVAVAGQLIEDRHTVRGERGGDGSAACRPDVRFTARRHPHGGRAVERLDQRKL